MSLNCHHRCLQFVDDPLEKCSNSSTEQLPLTIKQILDEERERSVEKESKDMWTPAAEAHYTAQMQSLNRKYQSFICFVNRLPGMTNPYFGMLGKLADFMETSISADLMSAKASELLKMVGLSIVDIS